MNLNKTLEKYGLSENESKVLLNVYRQTDATSFKISKETKIPKTTVYHTLESLREKGLVNSWKKNNVTYFYAESPKQLIKVLEDKIAVAEEIIPELRLMSRDKNRPSTRMYTGKEGIKTVLSDVLETAKTEKLNFIEAIFNKEFEEYFPKYTKKWIEDREKMKLRARILQPGGSSWVGKSYENNDFRETRILSGQFPIDGSMIIYKNKIAFFSVKDSEMYSVIIDSDTFSNIVRQLFLFSWSNLKEIKSVE